MSWTLEQLAFVARWTIWPLLHPLEEQLVDLRRRFSRLEAPAATVYLPPPAIQAGWRQECNFSSLEGDDGSFVGNADTSVALSDAVFLYRSVGGERITRAILSSMGAGGDDYDIEVEIQVTDCTRATASSYPTPIVLVISKGSDPVDISLDLALNPGDCLVAVGLTDWAGIRVDGTVFVEQKP